MVPMLNIKPSKRIALVAMMLLLAACAVNPVTGQRELGFVSEQRELTIGQQQYTPSQQGQGGKFSADPELSAYVQQVGNRLAAVSDRQLPYEFVVLNNSVPNAWALPGGKIAVNRGLLLELNTEAELAAVLGHEIVHAAARHGAQAMERGMLMQGAMVVGAIAVQGTEYADYAVGGAQLGAQLLTTRYGREAEREADAYGIRYMARAGYDPTAAISLQETFVRLSEGRNSGWIDGLFASHPPSQERVQNNRVLVAQLRAEGISGGEIGRERYQQATQFLRDTQPAYDAFDEAERLVAQNRLDEASRRLDSALSLVPNEARFLGLQADIAVYQGRYAAAVRQYDRAIAQDPNYFDYYLGRGVAYSRQGQEQAATRDLQASIKLLPTAMAMTELGDLSLLSNERAVAKQYYQIAAEAQGAIGQRSRNAFVQLDIADNPAQYISVRPYVTAQGRLMARVENSTALSLQNVRIDFQALQSGQVLSRSALLPTLAGGVSGDIDSGLSFPAGVTPSAEQVRVAVTAASVN